MKKLPEIYKNNFTKTIKNNKEVCYLNNRNYANDIKNNRSSKQEIKDTLNEIFNGIGYAYNIPVMINTINKTYETSLVAKTKKNIVTLENEVISIDDITSIKIL